jgi:GTP cyclohydrolase I
MNYVPKEAELDMARSILKFVGEDPSRDGLRETPLRYLKAMKEWTSGYGADPAEVLKTFEGVNNDNELIVETGIPVYSTCEHHMAPFFGHASIGYIPSQRIVGLSKLTRLVDIFARRLQVQERLTSEIADALLKHLEPRGVVVMITARHMCMESRGIRSQGQGTQTVARRGVMTENDRYRHEFLPRIAR